MEHNAVLRDYLISHIQRGKTNNVILAYLERDFGYLISERTLRNWLKRMNIQRHDPTVTQQQIAQAINVERSGPRKHCGIRYLHYALRTQHDLLITRDQVSTAVALIDPPVVRCNRQRNAWERHLYSCPGCNYRWCMDGYDKLQEFGIYIHGCVDQFSRFILWLVPYTTNRRPEIVLRYYLKALQERKVAPETTTSDFGHECDYIAQCQQYIFQNDPENETPHQWLYSVQNVTIESYWRLHRERSAQFWIEKFALLKNSNFFCGDLVDHWCIVAVFLPLIEDDLKSVVAYHHAHRIRKQRNRIRPSGAPEDMYTLPQLFKSTNRGTPVTELQIQTLMDRFHVDSLDLPDPLPVEVRRVVNHWLLSNGIRISLDNCDLIYKQMRIYIRRNINVD